MKVALYARVSTRDREQTPENQLIQLREWARRQPGYAVYGEYVDYASAKDMRGRTAWTKAMIDAKARRFDVLAVLRLDRAFRSVLDTHTYLETLQHYGIQFVTTTQPMDTRSSLGRLMLDITAAYAEFERSIIVERTLEGLERAKAEGKRLGRPKGSLDGKKRHRRART